MTPRWDWAPVMEPLARGLADRSDDLAAEIVRYARLEIPDLVGAPDGWEPLHAALVAGARNLADRLEHGEEPTDVELPRATLALVRDAARRGVPLIPLTRVYRFAHSVVLARGISRLTETAPGREALGAAAERYAGWLVAYLDRAQTIAEGVYVAEPCWSPWTTLPTSATRGSGCA